MRYRDIIGESISGKPLSEAPEIIGPTDFGMADEAYRYRFTRHLMDLHPQKVLEDTKDYELVRAGEGRVVYYYVLEKRYGRLAYFVKCEVADYDFIGETVTQVALWRDNRAGILGITTKVFYEYLLREWSTVMSDEQQTPDGKKFWEGQMAYANRSGYEVGLADLTKKQVIWCDKPYPEWIKDHEGAWATDAAAQNLRFVISGIITPGS